MYSSPDAAPHLKTYTFMCEAVTKQYSYNVPQGNTMFFDPFLIVICAFFGLRLGPKHRCISAQSLVGTHDFLAFTKIDHGRETTVRTIHRCDVEAIDEHRLRIVIEGSGFCTTWFESSRALCEVGRPPRC